MDNKSIYSFGDAMVMFENNFRVKSLETGRVFTYKDKGQETEFSLTEIKGKWVAYPMG